MIDRATRVLLVDGQLQDVNWVQELLAELEENRFGGGWRHGVEIFPVDRLADAIKILEYPDSQPVDAVLLNPNLPDSSGLPTLIKLRNHAPDVPVVILSETDDPDLGVSMVRAGAQDFLAKMELDSIPLARSIRLAVERGRILRDLRSTSAHDELTGLLNRNGFVAAADQDAETARRLGLALAVLVVTLEGIDAAARKYGKDESQLVVLEAAEALRQAVSNPHLPLGRLGPTSFAISVVAATRPEAESLLSQVQWRFAACLRKSNRTSLRFRSGLAWLAGRPYEAVSGSELVSSAERSLCENTEENPVAPAQQEHHFAAANASDSTRRHL